MLKEAASLPAGKWSTWRDEPVKGALDVKQGGRKQDCSTGSGPEKVEQEQLSGLEFLVAVGFDVLFDERVGRRNTRGLEWRVLMLIFMKFPTSAGSSFSPYLCLVLFLLSVNFPFSCFIPHLHLCLLVNLAVPLFFCVLVSSPFRDTIFVLGCAIYIF